ncbi:MAG: TrmH family RNA methyltransferase [Erysipelotrichaceae bacterium]|nr:TrmH family RNA methyltransferase [Erysipelotrichaceae bacterium]
MVGKYKKGHTYSYSLGTELTLELLLRHPQQVREVYVSSKQISNPVYERIVSLCKDNGIPMIQSDKAFNELSDKGNCYIIGVFDLYEAPIREGKKHIVLVNPSNPGNLGTIIRTSVGFGINDIAIITPAVDLYDPKTIRASMGSFFEAHFSLYGSFEEYLKQHGKREIYPFMLNGKASLNEVKHGDVYSLVFGNEATGLPEDFQNYGTSVIIRHLDTIDSLNLCNAVSIALYEFTKGNVGRDFEY